MFTEINISTMILSNWTPVASTSPVNPEEEFKAVTLGVFLITLALCLIGIYGNIISIVIFAQPMMRSSINILLTGLSSIDLGILILAIPVFVIPGFDAYKPAGHIVPWDYVYAIILRFVYPLIMIAQTSSVWTFVIISVERYLAVCYPLNVNKLMTASRAKWSQLLIVISSVVYNIIRFWEYQPSPKEPFYESYLRNNHEYFLIYSTILYLASHFVLPFTVILLLNIKMVKAINEAHRERRRLNPHQSQEYRTAQMIIVVTTMFGVCNTLAFVLNIWEAYQRDLFSTANHRFLAYLILDISNILILLNSASTFVIYLLYCNRYRLLFKNFSRFKCLLCTWSMMNRKTKFEWPFEITDVSSSMVLVQKSASMAKTSVMSTATTNGTITTQTDENIFLK